MSWDSWPHNQSSDWNCIKEVSTVCHWVIARHCFGRQCLAMTARYSLGRQCRAMTARHCLGRQCLAMTQWQTVDEPTSNHKTDNMMQETQIDWWDNIWLSTGLSNTDKPISSSLEKNAGLIFYSQYIALIYNYIYNVYIYIYIYIYTMCT